MTVGNLTDSQRVRVSRLDEEPSVKCGGSCANIVGFEAEVEERMSG